MRWLGDSLRFHYDFSCRDFTGGELRMSTEGMAIVCLDVAFTV